MVPVLPSYAVLRFALAGLLTAQVPEPPPPAAAVEWHAPPSCPGRAALLRGIEVRLGRALRPGELGIVGVVHVHASAPLYRLTLRLRAGPRGEQRSLGAETCSALVDATAVVAALAVEASASAPARPQAPPPPIVAVDPGVVAEPEPTPELPPPEPTSEPTSEPTPIPTTPPIEPPPQPSPSPSLSQSPSTPPPSSPRPPRRRGPGALVRLHGGPELGALPGITGAVGLAAGLLWRRVRLELQGLYLAPRTGSSPLGPIQAGLAVGAVHGCARPGRGLLEFPLCAGLEFGGMRGSVTGGGSATRLWLGAVLGAGLAVHVSPRWSLWAALQMVGSVVKPGFHGRDPGPELLLFQSEAVTGRLLLGVELRFVDPR